MIAVAPCYIVTVFDEAYAGVITIYPFSNLCVITFKAERSFVDVPMHTVG